MRFLILFTFLTNLLFASVTLSLESFTTQNEYVTWESGEYLMGTLEVGITTDENLTSIQMGPSEY